MPDSRIVRVIQIAFITTLGLLIVLTAISFRSNQQATSSKGNSLTTGGGEKEVDRTKIDQSTASAARLLSPETLTKFQQAANLAKQSHFRAAISLLEEYKPANPTEAIAVAQAQHQWANEILERSKNQYLQGNLEEAQRLAAAIPSTAIAYREYNQQKAQWMRNSNLLEEAKKLIHLGKEQQALKMLEQISDLNLKNSPAVQQLKNQIKARIQQQS